jgi:hypothetical protein
VEEAWRIVDPVLKAGTPVFEYEPKTWGPAEVEAVTPPGGWHNPVVTAVKNRMKIQVLADADAVAQAAAEFIAERSTGGRDRARPLCHGRERRPHTVADVARPGQ